MSHWTSPSERRSLAFLQESTSSSSMILKPPVARYSCCWSFCFDAGGPRDAGRSVTQVAALRPEAAQSRRGDRLLVLDEMNRPPSPRSRGGLIAGSSVWPSDSSLRRGWHFFGRLGLYHHGRTWCCDAFDHGGDLRGGAGDVGEGSYLVGDLPRGKWLGEETFAADPKIQWVRLTPQGTRAERDRNIAITRAFEPAEPSKSEPSAVVAIGLLRTA